MGDEAGVLIHDLGPKDADLRPVQLRLASCERLQSARLALGLMARVVEKQRPYQAAHEGSTHASAGRT